MLSLVVIGAGRSGTGWAARQLTESGTPCGHESVFDWHPTSDPTRRLDYPGRTPSDHEHPGPIAAEASLAAIAYLHTLSEDVALWHIARDPAACIGSWAHSGILEDDASPYGAFCRAQVPTIAGEEHPLGRAAAWVGEWNLLGWHRGQRHGRYRLERLEDIAGPERVNEHPHPAVSLAEVLAVATPLAAARLRTWARLAGYPLPAAVAA